MNKDAKQITMVILGATGDLTRRLLAPALYRLHTIGKLPNLAIHGYAVEDWSSEHFRDHIHESLKAFARDFREDDWPGFATHLSYTKGDITAAQLTQLKDQVKGPVLFYLALPPQLFAQAAQGLGQAGLADEGQGWRRLVVEKPFGWNLASAEALRQSLHTTWQESQILRIDHFLGKETVQNLMVFRFANRFLEPVWNSDHIAQVQITAAETLGLEGRFRYYDSAGALRDMLQNHLMQLFTLTAMEPPSVWDGEVLRDHKVEVLRSVRPIEAGRVNRHAVRGQYVAGQGAGQKVPGYLEEKGIPGNSITETFAALKLYVDNWRWRGVPFYLRSGKRLAADYWEIAIGFKEVPARLFETASIEPIPANWLVFRMKPDECIDLVAWAKEPGLEVKTRKVVLSTPYKLAGDVEFSAYEQLLLDAFEGDRSHFLRSDEVEWAWRILDPVISAWESGNPGLYVAGSQGPDAQNRLLEDGHVWRKI